MNTKSAQPDARRLARHHQGAGGRPAHRHRAADPLDDLRVHHQGELPHSGRVAGQRRSGQLGRAQAGARGMSQTNK